MRSQFDMWVPLRLTAFHPEGHSFDTGQEIMIGIPHVRHDQRVFVTKCLPGNRQVESAMQSSNLERKFCQPTFFSSRRPTGPISFPHSEPREGEILQDS